MLVCLIGCRELNKSQQLLPYSPLLFLVCLNNVHPRFPDGGKLTQYLENMKIGESIDICGPNGLLVYNGKGEFAIRD